MQPAASVDPPNEFDAFAHDYDAQLQAGLSATGEGKGYYALARARWVARQLSRIGFRADTILDYGCGTGTATPFLLSEVRANHVLGVDVSAESIHVAQQQFTGPRASFSIAAELSPAATIDLAFCNGVFHHIVPADRHASAQYVYDALRPGGIFAFWENNPWNPGTRYVMSRIAFDRDAITLTARESRALLRRAGFEVMRTDYLFVFPAALRVLRRFEPMMARLPLGGQYMVLARKPQTSRTVDTR